jgi:hypothetical protein
MISLAFLTMFSHGPLLTTHALVGTLVLLTAFVAIFAPWARRPVLYLLVLQIVIGGAVSGMLKLQPPVLHMLLAVLVGGVYAMAGASERRGRPPAVVRSMLVLAAGMIAYVYYIGEHALR